MFRLILFLSALIFVHSETFAQGHFPVIAMELQSIPIANHITNGQPDISDSTIFNVIMKVVVSDTSSASTFNVILKKDESEPGIIFTKNFTYDSAGNFPDGTSYSRSGYEITLGLGNFMGTIRPYAELVVSNYSGNITDPVIYY